MKTLLSAILAVFSVALLAWEGPVHSVSGSTAVISIDASKGSQTGQTVYFADANGKTTGTGTVLTVLHTQTKVRIDSGLVAPGMLASTVNPEVVRAMQECAAKKWEWRNGGCAAAMMTVTTRQTTHQASSIVVQGDAARLTPGGYVLKLDDILIIRANGGTLRLNQANIYTQSLNRRAGGFVTAENAFIPKDALREVRTGE